MYKVFFNDRAIFLTDDFTRNFQVRYGLFYKFRNKQDLEELIAFYNRLKRIDTLFIFHHDIDELRSEFRSCYRNIDAAGGLVRNSEGKYLFIKRRGYWDLPKGKADAGETMEQAALREVSEECGLKNLFLEQPLMSTYHTYHLKDELILKKTHWFSMTYMGNSAGVPQKEEDITEVRWFTPAEMPTVISNTYPSVTDLLRYCNLGVL